MITAGRGYACVFPQDAESPIWIPDRLIRPVNRQEKAEAAAKKDTEGHAATDEKTDSQQEREEDDDVDSSPPADS